MERRLSEKSEGSWRDSCVDLKSYIFKAYENCTFADVTFVVGENRDRVSAHKFVLMLRSPVFEKLLTDHKAGEEIVDPDLSKDGIKGILDYLYKDEFPEEKSKCITEVLKAAMKYKVDALLKYCANCLCDNLDLDNVWDAYYLFKENQGIEFRRVQTFIWNNATEFMNQDKFLILDLNDVCDVIGNDNFYADEVAIFGGLLRWAQNKCETLDLDPTGSNLRYVMDKSLRSIRFPLMEATQFYEIVENTNILLDNEKLELWKTFLEKATQKFDSNVNVTSMFVSTPRIYQGVKTDDDQIIDSTVHEYFETPENPTQPEHPEVIPLPWLTEWERDHYLKLEEIFWNKDNSHPDHNSDERNLIRRLWKVFGGNGK